jgi:hypothetical protein
VVPHGFERLLSSKQGELVHYFLYLIHFRMICFSFKI